jgi:hypothetical protein
MQSLISKGLVEEGSAWRSIPAGIVDGEVIYRDRKLIAVRAPLTERQREIEDNHRTELQARRRQILAELGIGAPAPDGGTDQ